MRSLASRTSARAIDNRCRSPTEKSVPPEPTAVSSPCGSPRTNAPAACQNPAHEGRDDAALVERQGPVDVRKAQRHRIEPVASGEGRAPGFNACLGGAVWRGRARDHFFMHRRPRFAQNRAAGGSVDEARHTHLSHKHQEPKRARDVDVEILFWICDRIDDIRVGREVHDRIHVPQHTAHQPPVSDVTFHELHVIVRDGISTAARFVIDHPDRLDKAALHDDTDQVGTDESAAPGNEDVVRHGGVRRYRVGTAHRTAATMSEVSACSVCARSRSRVQ